MKMSGMEKRFVNSRPHAEKNIALIDRLLKEVGLSQIREVLEVGCGTGAVAAHLAGRYGMKVAGTDLDPEQIALAKEKSAGIENLKFLQADAAALPFENNQFDMVVSMKVLHHISGWGQALLEVTRVLKPGGYYIFNDLAFSPFMARILRPVAKKFCGIYSVADIVAVCRRNGFEAIRSEKPHSYLLKHYSIVFLKNRPIRASAA